MLDQLATPDAAGQIEQVQDEARTFAELPEAAEQARYVVHLPLFEGPLDLLLHLIEKRQMEITTISLLAVTDQYMTYLQQQEYLQQLPLANMSAFVSIATRLMFIKSQSLLPPSPKDEKQKQE